MSRSAGGPDLGFTVHEIVKSDSWAGFSAGDKVTVAEPRFAGLTFELMNHSTNIRTGAQWVDLWGGTGKNIGIHTARPSSLRKKVDKTRQR
jgi:hypothetical protein